MIESNPSYGGISMRPATQRALIAAMATTIIAHADELTALDQALGDRSGKRGTEDAVFEPFADGFCLRFCSF